MYKLREGGKTNRVVVYFYEIEGVYNEYIRQKTMTAIGDDETETDLKTGVEAVKDATATVHQLSEKIV